MFGIVVAQAVHQRNVSDIVAFLGYARLKSTVINPAMKFRQLGSRICTGRVTRIIRSRNRLGGLFAGGEKGLLGASKIYFRWTSA